MFWFGLLIALVAGLLSIELSREAVKRRHPAIREYHLDIAAVMLLIVGLVLSALEHRASESEIASLEAKLQQVRSFEAVIRARAANWTSGKPPDVMSVVVDQSHPIALIDLQLATDGVQRLELLPTAVPKISPAEAEIAELTLQTRAKPGAWVFEKKPADLLGSKRIEFLAWGLDRSGTRDGRIRVLAVDIEIFINGSRFAAIHKEGGNWVELPEQPGKSGTLSWEEFNPFKAGV